MNIDQRLKNCLMETYNEVQSYNQYSQLQIFNNEEPSIYLPSYSDFLVWFPPMDNYDPWRNSTLVDQYANTLREDINQNLFNDFESMISSKKFQSTIVSRMKLPIWRHKDELINMIRNNGVVMIKGSTGCGKTTQVPQFILDTYIKSLQGSDCNIIVTQPRRISAISIAERVAFERGEEIRSGKCTVGYAVRFDYVYPRPYGSILFCTTGHLLRRFKSGLKGVSHLIIDEVHERDINTDLLLILIKDLIQVNPNLRVIIMSATLGVEHFQRYFNCHDVLEIDSDVHPVSRYFLEEIIETIRWKPKMMSYIDDDAEANENNSEYLKISNNTKISKQTMDTLQNLKEGVICLELIEALLEYIITLETNGSVLIFLPGWNTIFNLLYYLKGHHIFGDSSKYLLLPLHSQLSQKDNRRIFQYSEQRKIILSTNIAETSITIDDVVFVIDTCLIKRKIYCSRTNCTSFVIDWVSRSNIRQRQGRAGRVRSGYFFVLCTKNRYDSLEEFKKPEILVSNLIETSLLIKYLGIDSVQHFLSKALDAPPAAAINESLQTLQAINALDRDNNLTSLGLILAKMPIDPRIGRMVIESILLNVAGPMITIAAASSINFEIFDNSDLNSLLPILLKIDQERFSDHLITFKIYNSFEENESLARLNNPYVNTNSINVIRNARKQLINILVKSGFSDGLFALKPKDSYTPNELDLIAALLVTAYYPNVCIHKDMRRILTNEERIGLIHKTSVFYSYVNSQKVSKTTNLLSPVFIYSEKSQSRNLISSKQMTMVSFLQLLLFGTKIYEFPPNLPGASVTDTVVLDGWIEIKIDADVFDYIWQLKTEFERLLRKICYKPECDLNELDSKVLKAIELSCSFQNLSVNVIGKA